MMDERREWRKEKRERFKEKYGDSFKSDNCKPKMNCDDKGLYGIRKR